MANPIIAVLDWKGVRNIELISSQPYNSNTAEGLCCTSTHIRLIRTRSANYALRYSVSYCLLEFSRPAIHTHARAHTRLQKIRHTNVHSL